MHNLIQVFNVSTCNIHYVKRTL